jgi:nitric oxide reductase NorE protein
VSISTDARRIPGEPGLWIIIFGDLAVFSVFFTLFPYYRLAEPDLFARSQALLSQTFGLANTLLLLTSSWAVAAAMSAARDARAQDAVRKVSLGMLCGAGFVVLKAFEYAAKVSAGIRPSTNDFFMLYFAFTGVHLIHVVIGLGALSLFRARAAKLTTPVGLALMEGCAIFWHLVDLLWVVLFALFYLHR